MALYAGLDVSFDNTWGWKGTQEKAEEVNSKKAYISNDETVELSESFTLVLI
jgi:hypothetical protein